MPLNFLSALTDSNREKDVSLNIKLYSQALVMPALLSELRLLADFVPGVGMTGNGQTSAPEASRPIKLTYGKVTKLV